MQKFLEKRDIIPHSLASFERPNPENFLRKVFSDNPELKCSVLPNGKPHGEVWSKIVDELGVSEERTTYKLGLLHGSYHCVKSNIFFGTEATKGYFKEHKPHGEFVFGTIHAFYEDGKLLRHECEARCPYLCSRDKETSVMQWEHQGEDLIVSQKTKQEKDWDTVVRYKSIYFDEEKWMSLPYGKIGVFSSPVPDILSKRVYAKSCIFEKGEGRSFEEPLVVPYFLY
uniref:Uncharacterized protein n=1 Tax=Marseillevirus sp. TaxID=2809551 RepID=A0AA96IZ77_9VIRU|nr:hypothetical protein MarDSR_315 [Marseillevirus sp.]